MDIVGIRSADFAAVYPKVREHFESFAKRSRGETTVAGLIDDVLSKERQCWIAVENGEVFACALTKVKDGAMRTVMVTHAAGREMDRWREQSIRHLMEWAKSIGAERFKAMVRPGWVPFLKNVGMRETHRLLEVNL